MSSTNPVGTADTTQAVITPYAAAKLVNVVLVEADLPPVRPQMLYNYTAGRYNKGERPLIAYTPETGVSREDLVRWVKAYIEKKQAGKVTHEPLDLS